MIHHLPRPLRPKWLNDLLDELADANDRCVGHAEMERYWQARAVLHANQAALLRKRLDLADRMLSTISPTTTEDR